MCTKVKNPYLPGHVCSDGKGNGEFGGIKVGCNNDINDAKVEGIEDDNEGKEPGVDYFSGFLSASLGSRSVACWKFV